MRLILLIHMAALLLILLPADGIASVEELSFGSCHIERKLRQHVKCSLKENFVVPLTFNVEAWSAFVGFPPKCDSQHLESAQLLVVGNPNLKGHVVPESSWLKREVLFTYFRTTDCSSPNTLSIEANYSANLYTRELVSGEPPMPAMLLSEIERQQALGTSELLDFNAPQFQTWLANNDLRKRPGEDEIWFALRAFKKIRAEHEYEYIEKQARTISNLTTRKGIDCGGACGLLVGTLRANQIPARCLIGKWAQSSDNSNDGIQLAQSHVKAEFYASKIGWIPVEMSGAVERKELPPLNYFGRDDGNFLTLQIDPDMLLDTEMFGTKTIHFLQNAAIWFRGRGRNYNPYKRTRTWIVECNPLSP